jgi:hypothetical protein
MKSKKAKNPSPIKTELQDSELNLAGALLQDAEFVGRVLKKHGITSDSILEPTAKTVIDSGMTLLDAGVPCEPNAVKKNSGLEASIIQKLIDDCPTSAHAEYHIGIIRHAYRKRLMARYMSEFDNVDMAYQKVCEILPEIGADSLPTIENGELFATREILRPAEVIHGILYAGAKMVYGGPSKANKTWVLYDLGLAVATGGTWLGFQCTRGRVLYINLELQAFDAQDRVKMIAKARGVNVPSLFDVWNLRGFAVAIEEMKPHILKMAMGAGYSLIIVDPCYKVMGDREENNPRDIASMLNHFEDIAVKTGSAFAYGAHFAKGNSSSKNAIDRISGSGVHARDPDAILTATPHSTEECFTIDATLRSFPRVDPFAIRWDFPRMVKDETLDPCDLKQATSGRPAEHTLKDVLCFVGDEPITAKAWKQRATEDGVPVRSFYRLRKQAINSKAVIKGDDDTFTKSGGLYE